MAGEQKVRQSLTSLSARQEYKHPQAELSGLFTSRFGFLFPPSTSLVIFPCLFCCGVLRLRPFTAHLAEGKVAIIHTNTNITHLQSLIFSVDDDDIKYLWFLCVS